MRIFLISQYLFKTAQNVLFHEYLLTTIILMLLFVILSFLPLARSCNIDIYTDSPMENAIHTTPFRQWLLVSIFVGLPMFFDIVLDWRQIYGAKGEVYEWVSRVLLNIAIVIPNLIIQSYLVETENEYENEKSPHAAKIYAGILPAQIIVLLAAILTTTYKPKNTNNNIVVEKIFLHHNFEETSILGLLILVFARFFHTLSELVNGSTQRGGIYVFSQILYIFSILLLFWVIFKKLWLLTKNLRGYTLDFRDHFLLADFWRILLLLAYITTNIINYSLSPRLLNPAPENADKDYLVAFLLTQIVITCFLTVVPGRSYKLLAELKRQQLETRLNLIRYVSHEMRTPLNTAFMGLTMLTLGLQDLHQNFGEFQNRLKKNFGICFPENFDKSFLNGNSLENNEILLDFLNKLSNFLIPESLNDMIDTVKYVTESCHVALATLDDLLTFDKIDEKKLVIELDDIDPCAFVEKTSKPFAINALHSEVQFSVEIGFLNNECVIKADKFKLSQVLRNLISNALKFTPKKGEVKIIVEILKNTLAESDTENMLRVAVVDTGPGISKENQKKLFGQYVQFDAAKLQQGKGSGLGLWITKSIVELHMGRVCAESDGEGYGSTFFFDLPLFPKDTSLSDRNESENEYLGTEDVKLDLEEGDNSEPRPASDSLKSDLSQNSAVRPNSWGSKMERDNSRRKYFISISSRDNSDASDATNTPEGKKSRSNSNSPAALDGKTLKQSSRPPACPQLKTNKLRTPIIPKLPVLRTAHSFNLLNSPVVVTHRSAVSSIASHSSDDEIENPKYSTKTQKTRKANNAGSSYFTFEEIEQREINEKRLSNDSSRESKQSPKSQTNPNPRKSANKNPFPVLNLPRSDSEVSVLSWVSAMSKTKNETETDNKNKAEIEKDKIETNFASKRFSKDLLFSHDFTYSVDQCSPPKTSQNLSNKMSQNLSNKMFQDLSDSEGSGLESAGLGSENSSVAVEINPKSFRESRDVTNYRKQLLEDEEKRRKNSEIYNLLEKSKSSRVYTNNSKTHSQNPEQTPNPTNTQKEPGAMKGLPGLEAKPSWSKGLDFLIVDDSQPTRKMCGKLLTRCGHYTEEAEDGQACLDLLNLSLTLASSSTQQDMLDVPPRSPLLNFTSTSTRSLHTHSYLPQVILLDDNMPRLRGAETARELRNFGFSGLIYGVTGTVDEKETKRFLEFGANAVFSKPLNIQLLKTQIEHDLGKNE